MKRKFGIYTLLGITFFSLAVAFTATIAWFSSVGVTFSNDRIEGKSDGAYFAYGKGTADEPFGISNTRHLNNLAWLQYSGEFNKGEHVHFELANDINKDGSVYYMPPIGTAEYPFIGVFNGNEKGIYNINITNKNSFTNLPRGITDYNQNDAEIIGFFGVVGELNEEITYSSSDNSVFDLFLDNITISTHTTNTLVGLAAGYVNASINNVRVGKSTIQVNNSKPIESITNNLSDYSLVGYTSSTSTISDFTKDVSDKFSKSVSGGSTGGFGASVNFRDYIKWFWDLQTNKGYDPGAAGTRDVGYMVTGYYTSNTRGYNLKSGTDYNLAHNLTGLSYSSALGNPDTDFSITYATISTSTYTDITFGFKKSGNSYYGTYNELYRNNANNVTRSFTATTSGSGNTLKYVVTFDEPVSLFSNNTIVDLKSTNTGATNFRVYEHNGSTELGNKKLFVKSTVHVYHLTNSNYIPLNFNKTHTSTSSDNTGYIIGTSLASGNDPTYLAGSPRISSYQSSTYLNGSLTEGKISTIKTYYNGGWTTITDTIDPTTGSVISSDKDYERYIESRNAIGETIEGTGENPATGAVHAIHFDVSSSVKYENSNYYKGSVGNDSSDTYVEKDMLLKEYNNTVKKTRMPKGCIDFTLEKAGYINFFAGMYNASDSATSLNFFSLHHIIRSSPLSYTIKEIKKIYKSTTWTGENPNYVYQYSDDSYSSGEKTGNALFDLSETLWKAREKDNSIYYFEIPVNGGEYAMGAVDKSHTGDNAYQGAYMLYLDIGANGRSSGNTTLTSNYVKTNSNSDNSPNGVDFNVTGLPSGSGGNTICIKLTYDDIESMSTSITGQIIFNPGTKVVTDSMITGAGCSYDPKQLLDDTNSTIKIDDLKGDSGGGNRIITASILTNTGEAWTIKYEDLLDKNDDIISSKYLSAFRNTVDVTNELNSGTLSAPEIFTSNISDIRNAEIALELEYHGADFTIESVEYNEHTIILNIPDDELGTTDLDVSYPSGVYDNLVINRVQN